MWNQIFNSVEVSSTTQWMFFIPHPVHGGSGSLWGHCCSVFLEFYLWRKFTILLLLILFLFLKKKVPSNMVKRNFKKNFQTIATFGRFFPKKNSQYFSRIWADFRLSSFEITIFKLICFIPKFFNFFICLCSQIWLNIF